MECSSTPFQLRLVPGANGSYDHAVTGSPREPGDHGCWPTAWLRDISGLATRPSARHEARPRGCGAIHENLAPKMCAEGGC